MIPQDLMSSQLVPDTWFEPDDRARTLLTDYEAGPLALSDTSLGLFYQNWNMNWDTGTGNFILAPETTGSSSFPHNAASVSQLSFCFDQNAHVNIAYTSNSLPYLYWYDTALGSHVATALPTTVFCPTITLDDKREKMSGTSDIILWWTEQQVDSSWNLYRAYQRERFDPLVPKLMKTGVFPFVYKSGMHRRFRLQLELRTT